LLVHRKTQASVNVKIFEMDKSTCLEGIFIVTVLRGHTVSNRVEFALVDIFGVYKLTNLSLKALGVVIGLGHVGGIQATFVLIGLAGWQKRADIGWMCVCVHEFGDI
jgi:hypothetical protein